METVKRTSIPAAMSLFTSQIIDVLVAKEGPGAETTDEVTTEACGRDTRVGGDGYNYLLSAIRWCRRNRRVNWERIRGANRLRCLNAYDTLESVKRDRRIIGKKARVGIQKLGNVSADELSPEDRPKFNVEAAQLGMLALAAAEKTTKRLTEQDGAPQTPKLPELLEMMTSSGK